MAVYGDLLMLEKLLRRLAPLIGDSPELRSLTDHIHHLIALEFSKRLVEHSGTLQFTDPKKGH